MTLEKSTCDGARVSAVLFSDATDAPRKKKTMAKQSKAQQSILDHLANGPRRCRVVAPVYVSRCANYLTQRTYDALIDGGHVRQVEYHGMCSPGNAEEVTLELASK